MAEVKRTTARQVRAVATPAATATATAAAGGATAAGPAETKARRAIRAAASDGKVNGKDKRALTKAGIEQPQIKLLRQALTVKSDAQKFLTRAEVTAVLRNDPLPDATTMAVRRIMSAASDGTISADEATRLKERGMSNEVLDRVRAALRANGGKPLTQAQAMAAYTGAKDPVDPVDPEIPVTPTKLPGVEPMSEVNAAGYQLAKFPSSGGGGGQADAAGNLYVPDGNTVRVFDADNKPLSVAKLPFTPVDVAPGPNGDYIYAIDGRTPKKLVKGADGNYTVDATFKMEPFPYGGKNYNAEAYRIATDHSGNLFVADGMWSGNMIHTVIKYDTAGKYQTRFGEYASGNKEDAASWAQGNFYWGLGGIAVSPDGNSVYTTEVGNSRVQKWDAGANGMYTSTAMWGNTQADDPDRIGSDAPGKFAAPYDVGVDGEGNVYVMNTTASQIQKFTATGQFITSMYMGNDPNVRPAASVRGHGMAVTARGDAVSVETGRMMHRA